MGGPVYNTFAASFCLYGNTKCHSLCLRQPLLILLVNLWSVSPSEDLYRKLSVWYLFYDLSQIIWQLVTKKSHWSKKWFALKWPLTATKNYWAHVLIIGKSYANIIWHPIKLPIYHLKSCLNFQNVTSAEPKQYVPSTKTIGFLYSL